MRTTLLAICAVAAAAAQVVPPNELGISMGHIHIVTPNPEAHRKLWRDVLGGQLRRLGPLEYYMFPGVLVGLREGPSQGGTDDSAVNHLGFLTRDLAATRAKLVAAGVPIVKEMPDTRQFFAMFPDQVKVEFSEDHNLATPYAHHHIHFACHEVEAQRAWYAKVFHAIPGKRSKFLAADLPGVNLSWNPADKPQAPTKGRAMDHFGFEVRNLKAFCDRLLAEGYTLEMPYTERPDLGGLKIAFIVDPWGARVELTEGLASIR
jgi:catechol 2,3-dioxygenase-like lactoylglutathione lyase family enzyme